MPKTSRAVIKIAVLNALRSSRKAMTVGDLFLITEYSQPMVMKVLKELRDEGVVASEVRKTRTKIYSGYYVDHKAIHWWLVNPVSRTRSRRKNADS